MVLESRADERAGQRTGGRGYAGSPIVRTAEGGRTGDAKRVAGPGRHGLWRGWARDSDVAGAVVSAHLFGIVHIMGPVQRLSAVRYVNRMGPTRQALSAAHRTQ
jgi:hypothetical protein